MLIKRKLSFLLSWSPHLRVPMFNVAVHFTEFSIPSINCPRIFTYSDLNDKVEIAREMYTCTVTLIYSYKVTWSMTYLDFEHVIRDPSNSTNFEARYFDVYGVAFVVNDRGKELGDGCGRWGDVRRCDWTLKADHTSSVSRLKEVRGRTREVRGGTKEVRGGTREVRGETKERLRGQDLGYVSVGLRTRG